MNNKIRIGIVGYGNLGKGVEKAIDLNTDMELISIFTRRNPANIKSKSKLLHISKALDFKDKIDVMILCGGSAKDLDEQTPFMSLHFNTVDSFDNHKRIPEYFEKINKIAYKANKLSLISVGWDPGLFSLNRLLFQSILPNGFNYTFWGPGVSQGHSDAIRKVNGVKDGVQYTIPLYNVLENVKNHEVSQIPPCHRHKRVCYIVCEDNEDPFKIEKEIKNMPHYFADYETQVYFISQEELEENHKKMPHGGTVIRTGNTSLDNNHRLEIKISLDNNSEFTGSVILAYSRAVYKMRQEGKTGAISIFDIPIKYLSNKSNEELRKTLL